MTNITEQVAQLHNKILGHKWDLTKQLPTSNELLRDLTDFRQQARDEGYKEGINKALDVGYAHWSKDDSKTDEQWDIWLEGFNAGAECKEEAIRNIQLEEKE